MTGRDYGEPPQEALCRAYVEAVAAQCGATISYPSMDYGIDFSLNHVTRNGSVLAESGVKLDVQAKSARSDADLRADFGYDLDVRGYDALRVPAVRVPRLLILLVLPRGDAWVSSTADGLTRHRRAFWLSLRGRPAVRNRRSVRATVPAANVFDPPALDRLFRSAAEEMLR